MRSKNVIEDKRFTKKRAGGRAPGTANAGSTYVQSENMSYRCTEGYKNVVELLCVQLCKKKTQVLHEAMAMYATRHANSKELINEIVKIL